MNQELRDRVDNYLNGDYIELSSLYFEGYESSKEEFNSTKYTVEDMCRRVLILTQIYPSYDSETKEYKCSSQRNRSSLDIWRHIKYYYPDVTIYDVMNSLYDLYEKNDGFLGFYCGDIYKRVFKIGKRMFNEDYMVKVMLDSSGREFDEYGLKWNDWKDI